MLKFTNIQHDTRKELKLSCIEYVFLDMVYNLQVNPKSIVKDWCYAKKETLAEEIGVSRQSIHNLIKKLSESGLLIKDNETSFLQTTEKWYNNLTLHNVKKVDNDVKKVDTNSVKKLYTACKETLHYNNIDNNNIIYNKEKIIKKERDFDLSSFDFNFTKKEIADKYKQTLNFNENPFEYCVAALIANRLFINPKDKVSELAYKGLLSKLKKLSDNNPRTAMKMTQNSIDSNWKSFYKLKEEEVEKSNKMKLNIKPIN